MRTIVVGTFLSLDGVMQAPGGPEEDPTGGFSLGGWSVNYWDEVGGQVMGEWMNRPAELLLGRKTYEIFAAYWPYITDNPMADVLNRARKHVASTTLDKVEWNNSTLIKGDVGDYVSDLKDQDGPEMIQVHGSGNLIQTLLRRDLVDEFNVWTLPLLLGSGKRLFAEGTIPAALRTVDVKTSTTGVVIATYERAGDVVPGSFVTEAPSEAELARRQKLADTA